MSETVRRAKYAKYDVTYYSESHHQSSAIADIDDEDNELETAGDTNG
jgi:hypothetical protein